MTPCLVTTHFIADLYEGTLVIWFTPFTASKSPLEARKQAINIRNTQWCAPLAREILVKRVEYASISVGSKAVTIQQFIVDDMHRYLYWVLYRT